MAAVGNKRTDCVGRNWVSLLH